jgi:hypothetical protein
MFLVDATRVNVCRENVCRENVCSNAAGIMLERTFDVNQRDSVSELVGRASRPPDGRARPLGAATGRMAKRWGATGRAT